VTDLDVAIVGAGFGGMYALHHLRGRGLRCRVFEAGTGVGGTWYWNRYPGARVDVESLEYSYSFDTELEQEWEWAERYPAQPEVLRYLENVAERHDLLRDIQLDTHIVSMAYDGAWTLTDARGESVSARYVVAAVGFLSARHFPPIPGLREGTFAGPIVHTGSWPKEGLELADRRVGLIGTGASGVQVIPRVAEEAASLRVYQRSPHWCVPLQNCPMPPDYQRRVKADYPELRRAELESFSGFVLTNFELPPPGRRGRREPAVDVDEAEREREYEFRWQAGGLCLYNSFGDLLVSEEANRTLQDFVARKVRSIVKDPEVAELLIPKDHPILSKRLCGESGYYEAFNRENVTLVNVRGDPIEAITPTGLRVASGAEHDLDAIICATGYDAATGSLLRIDIRGRDGRTLREHWARGTRTHLGAMSHGFPNLFFLDGPQAPSAFFLPPIFTQYQAEWVGRVIEHMHERGARAVEPTAEAEEGWRRRVNGLAARSLLPRARNQLMGDNVAGKPRECLYYLGGYADYAQRCEQVMAPDQGEFVWA
jgi:cyclohexanone monooxygenase